MIFLSACVSKNINNNNEVLDFNKELTYDEFKALLEKYDKYKGFPSIGK